MSKKRISKKAEYEEVEVAVKLHRYPPETLWLRVAVGEGTIGEQKVELSINAAGSQPIVRIGDGPWYALDWESLVRAVDDAENKRRGYNMRA